MKVPISETRSAMSKWRKIGTRSGRPKPAEFRTAESFSVLVANGVLPTVSSVKRQPNIIEDESAVQASFLLQGGGGFWAPYARDFDDRLTWCSAQLGDC